MRIKSFLLHYDRHNSCEGVMTQLLSGAARQSRAKSQQCKQRPGEKHIVSQTQQSQASKCSTFWSLHFHLSPWQMDGVYLQLWDRLLAQDPTEALQKGPGDKCKCVCADLCPITITISWHSVETKCLKWKNERSQNSLHCPPGTLGFFNLQIWHPE